MLLHEMCNLRDMGHLLFFSFFVVVPLSEIT